MSPSGLIKITCGKGRSFKHLFRFGKDLSLLRGRKKIIKGLILPFLTSQLPRWLNCSALLSLKRQRVRLGESLAWPHQFSIKQVEDFPLTTMGFGRSHKAAKYLLGLTSQPVSARSPHTPCTPVVKRGCRKGSTSLLFAWFSDLSSHFQH